MCDDHESSVSIGGRLNTNFCFADDIVVNAEEEEEAGVLVDRLDKTTTRYKNRSRQDKSDDKQPKLLPKRDQDERSETRRSGELQIPWAIISNEGLKPEILSRIAQTTAAISRLKIIWRDKNIF